MRHPAKVGPICQVGRLATEQVVRDRMDHFRLSKVNNCFRVRQFACRFMPIPDALQDAFLWPVHAGQPAPPIDYFYEQIVQEVLCR